MKIHKETTIPATPARVFELLTNGAKLGDITGKPGKGGGAPGAVFTLFDGWVEGRQIEMVPNERVVQAWRFRDWEPGVYSLVRFTLTQDGSETKMDVDQDGHPEQFHEHLDTNWPGFYFEPMQKHFARN